MFSFAPRLLLIAPATLLVAFLRLGELPTPLGVMGGAVTLAGVALPHWRPRLRLAAPPVGARA